MIKAPNASIRSKAYHGTVENTVQGRAEFDAVKKEAREFNKEQRRIAKQTGTLPQVKKVDAFGRLGENNPNAILYRENPSPVQRRLAYQRIKRVHAATLDIYVYHFQQVELTNRWETPFNGNPKIGIRHVA